MAELITSDPNQGFLSAASAYFCISFIVQVCCVIIVSMTSNWIFWKMDGVILLQK